MKIRRGFVSNSSSSSFCLFGWIHPDPSILTLIRKIAKEHPEIKFIETLELYHGIGILCYTKGWEDEYYFLQKIAKEKGISLPSSWGYEKKVRYIKLNGEAT